MGNLHKWLLRVPGILTFFMVVALGVTLANLLWMVLTPPTAVAQAAGLNKTSSTVNAPQKQNYGKIIADQHIFGAIPKAAPKQVKAPTPTPKAVKPVVTNLNLKLHGIIASKSGKGGFAMISYNGKTQEVYIQGEPIPKAKKDEERELDGVTVKSIGDKVVVIDNNGTEQSIELPSLSDKSSGSSTASRSTQRATSTRAKPRVLPRSTTNDDGMPNPDPANNGQAQSLAELREQALDDPSVLMSVITPSIVRKDGAVTGIRVYPSRNRKMFRELGLRNGDIITQVNDIIIDDPNKGMEIFEQISSAPSLSITITRGGNEQVLTPQF